MKDPDLKTIIFIQCRQFGLCGGTDRWKSLSRKCHMKDLQETMQQRLWMSDKTTVVKWNQNWSASHQCIALRLAKSHLSWLILLCYVNAFHWDGILPISRYNKGNNRQNLLKNLLTFSLNSVDCISKDTRAAKSTKTLQWQIMVQSS